MSDRKSPLRRLISRIDPKQRTSLSATDKPSPTTKRINLALQGGGAHGAFTWGVLDVLLADGRLTIDGISGTSAGAVNAVMVADGLARGGPDTGRANASPRSGRLRRKAAYCPTCSAMWWSGCSLCADAGLVRRHGPVLVAAAAQSAQHQSAEGPDRTLRRLRGDPRPASIRCSSPATNVLTGELRVFTREEISAEAVMASACLPLLFRAVEIDGQPYWDGGYTGNPPLIPFLRHTDTEDVLLVQINPVTRRGVPTSTHDITDRVSEISFNSGLLAELRAVEFVTKLIDEGALPHGVGDGLYRRVRPHRITLDDSGEQFDADSKLKLDQKFFANLHELGRAAMGKFLDTHFSDIGARATINVVVPTVKCCGVSCSACSPDEARRNPGCDVAVADQHDISKQQV